MSFATRLLVVAAISFASGDGAAMATDIGQIAFHGADLRSLCHNQFDEAHELCNHKIDELINENVAKSGMQSDLWDIPSDAQLESLEQNVVNYMDGGVYQDLEQSDAHVLIGLVMACRYPSAATAAKIAANPSYQRECGSLDGKPNK